MVKSIQLKVIDNGVVPVLTVSNHHYYLIYKDAAPFVNESGSDSSSLDNMLELFLAGGMDLYRAMRLLMPPAWQNSPNMDDDLRAFYEFNSMHMEPWDGPAGVVMTNGRHVACNLDRNGLRPARYVITRNGFITLSFRSRYLGLRRR